MSRENVELVRTTLEEFVAHPERGLPATVAEDLVWEPPPEWPEPGAVVGHAGFMEFFNSWVDAFDQWSQEIERVVDAGGDLVLGIMHQHGTARGSAIEVELRYGVVYTVAGGTVITHALFFTNVDDALKAAGLDELPA